MTEPDWHAIAADLMAALDREIEEITQRNRGSTHWDGCEESHPKCAAVKRMKAARAKAIKATASSVAVPPSGACRGT